MKAATLRAFLSVHSWMGLLAGMALFIAFYAGAITVFTHALSNWQTTPSATQAAPADPVAAAQTLLDTVIAAHPQVAESFLVLLPGEHGPLARVYWYGPQADASGGMRQYQLSSSGTLLELPQRVGFADFLYDLHFTAGLPRTFGTYLFGVVSVLYGLALVSGVVLYAPVFFKDLFALRIGANLKRLWQDAHNVVGMLSLPFHVIFAWSGAVLCLGCCCWRRSSFWSSTASCCRSWSRTSNSPRMWHRPTAQRRCCRWRPCWRRRAPPAPASCRKA